MKIVVHVFGQTAHHNVPMQAFLSSATKNVNAQQQYWAWYHAEQGKHAAFTYYDSGKHLFKKMKAMPTDTVFIFHGMFERQVWPYLLFSNLIHRCAWQIWGADMYQHQEQRLPLKRKLMNVIHILLTKKMRKVSALNKGDAQIAKQTFGIDHLQVLPYPLIGVEGTDNGAVQQSETKRILVGNSAAESNHHIDAFSWLSQFKEQNIEIVVPLNYGGPEAYVKTVVEHGTQVFGDKFTPITSMLSKSEYDDLLTKIDICVFAHKRQQGLYAVYSMFLNGGKVFVRSDTSTFSSMRDMEFEISDSLDIAHMQFEMFSKYSERTVSQNRRLMQNTYSEEALLPKWKAFIEALIA
ncbi:TDP-N-acetylfucosamine:lipid II N-acetylfucosaminyltransferase [Aestuariibacter sp. AA17]|uniref:TDP-N-acetylfucosamine:lipid II N-acetylfucosaminyltransferase n=1 Tax=Fluctibacter corallii TaxID=2984329 RepID=A0ABT3A3R4_9ALTE|nr:TDP-N-acetylfucosamine:lipid II N-acetylfucosaminyltransferase [Aestuariibacter sp. AA17]MCV2883279.1 TDP-N-acetylfucosamine:lipid II N-acetylfucosaminyltransferase [Aestuariibacter sp. AA17]